MNPAPADNAPVPHHIAGRRLAHGPVLALHNPANGQILRWVHVAEGPQIVQALASARSAQPAWAARAPDARAQVLARLQRRAEDDRELLQSLAGAGARPDPPRGAGRVAGWSGPVGGRQRGADLAGGPASGARRCGLGAMDAGAAARRGGGRAALLRPLESADGPGALGAGGRQCLHRQAQPAHAQPGRVAGRSPAGLRAGPRPVPGAAGRRRDRPGPVAPPGRGGPERGRAQQHGARVARRRGGAGQTGAGPGRRQEPPGGAARRRPGARRRRHRAGRLRRRRAALRGGLGPGAGGACRRRPDATARRAPARACASATRHVPTAIWGP
jgi:hypothetical protein